MTAVSYRLGYETSQWREQAPHLHCYRFSPDMRDLRWQGQSRNYVSQPSGKNGVLIIRYETSGAIPG